MLSPDSRRFLGPVLVWLGGAGVSFTLFVIWAKQRTLPHREVAASIGGLACLVSLIGLVEVIRRAIAPASTFMSVSIYVVGIGFSLIAAFTYTLVFSFLWAKNF